MSKANKNPTSKRLNKLMYTISLLTGGLALVCTIMGFILGLNSLAYYHLVTVFIYIYCAFISKKGNLFYSRIIFFILLNLGITTTASFVGRAGSVEYMFLYSLALPFSVFSFKTEKRFVYFFSHLSGVLWITLAITNFKLFTNTPIDPEIALTYIYPISVLCTFLMVVVQLSYFSILGVKYYTNIRNKKIEALELEIKNKDSLTQDEKGQLAKLIYTTFPRGVKGISGKEGEITYSGIPFSVVEEVPIFPGCENAEDKRACFNKQIQKHISKNFNYPQVAQDQGIQGRVNVMFTIQKDGTIGNLRMRGPDKLLENEVERIIKRLPKMTPGQHKDELVGVPFSIPVTFKLE